MKKIFLAFILCLFSISLASAIDWNDAAITSYWKMDENSGNIYDSTLNGINGIVVGSPAYQRQGILNGSIDTGGLAANQFNFTSYGYYSHLQNFSISYWIYFDDWDSQNYHFDTAYEGDAFSGITLYSVNGGYTFSTAKDTGIQGAVSLPASSLVAGRWYHIIDVFRDGNMTVYINGTFNASSTTTIYQIAGANKLSLGMGGGVTSYGFDGRIDEFGFWNRTLTGTEITDLYNGGLGASFSGGVKSITVSLVSPPDSYGAMITPIFNASLLPLNLNLTNATFYLWYANGSNLNISTNKVNGTALNYSTFTPQNLTSGSYYWNVLGCGNDNSTIAVCSFAPSNYTLFKQQFNVTGQYYSNTTYDTDNSTFMINISLDPASELFSASLIYNGTKYLYDSINDFGSGYFQAIKTIDIPKVLLNITKDFYWEFTFDSGGGFSVDNSTNTLFNVSVTNITNSGTVRAINYTILDEETLAPINVNFNSMLSWFLGSGTSTKEDSFSLIGIRSAAFYLAPNHTFYTDSRIELTNASNSNNTYYDRVFDFNLDILNETTKEVTLLMMGYYNGTKIIIEVKDEGLAPMDNIYVTIKRFYPGTNTYKTVENRRTDAFGQIAVRLIEDNVKYKIFFYDSNNTILKETSDITISCRSSICIVPFVIKSNVNQLERYNNISGFSYTFKYNNNTNNFAYTWNDNTGKSSSYRLFVEKVATNGTYTVCNSVSTASAGTLSCNVGSATASYRAQAFRQESGKSEVRMPISINIKVDNTIGRFGLEGLMWGFILMFTLVLFGLYSPAVGVVLYLAGMIFLGATGIVYINPAIAIAQIVIGVLFIWSFKS